MFIDLARRGLLIAYFRFLDESFGDIFVRLYDSIGTSCILRYINYHGFAR